MSASAKRRAEDAESQLEAEALRYHRMPRPGKIATAVTKPLSESDLALAYSPGVAAPCRAIAASPDLAAQLTGRANLVGVITNGTAVLGLGDIGPLASKPVMEGKVALFRCLAGVDAFDLEVDCTDIDRFVDLVTALEPTFGGVNLEDIRSPDCFEIERRLRERLRIPVFHDDQHGTAVVCAAAIRNALALQKKNLQDIQVVTSGAGAAAIATVDLLVAMGLPASRVTLTDVEGVVHQGRPNLPARVLPYARPMDARRLPDILVGADVFLGLSAGGVLNPRWLALMADRPLILALANPEPEIRPGVANAARPDAIVATGRSDYPNQVNNVLCFPYLFRGALDVGATEINLAMMMAASEAVAALGRSPLENGDEGFGPCRILPGALDPRLAATVAPAVAAAAAATGVARRPLNDLDAYAASLTQARRNDWSHDWLAEGAR